MAKSLKKAEKSPNTYRGVDLEAVAQFSLPGGDFSSWFKLGDDKLGVPVAVRLLPPMGKMQGLPWVVHQLHYYGRSGFQTVEGKKRAITCRRAMDLGSCPVCDVVHWAEEHEQDQLAEDLKLKTQCYTQIIARDDDKLYRWTTPAMVIKSWQALFNNKRYADFTHPEKGRDSDILKTGMPGQWNTIRYSATPDASPSAINHPGWQKEAQDLTALIQVLDLTEIQQILALNLGKLVPLAKIFTKGK